ncbi:MAG TPA: hypothetical protein ENH12_04810 [Proteobacteria bacterium]|nr:hypothetical protein [Pseudomonadota bacterium]
MNLMTKASHEEVSDLNTIQDQTVFLEIENELLKERLGLSDFCSYFAGDMDPPALNHFLRHISFMENIGPEKPIRSLFPPNITFPPAEEMTETDLASIVEFLEDTLMDNGILLELSPTLPANIKYKYIVEEMLSDLIPDNIPDGAALHYNGCGGWCPECFQKDYCEMKKELWPDP